jgi:protein O-GlcNAc transferase
MLSWLKAKLAGNARRSAATSGADEAAINKQIKEGYQLHLAREYARAEAIYRSVLEQRPGHADVLYLLSTMKHRQGNTALAIDLGEQAARAAPGIAAMHAHLAELYHGANRLPAAEASYRKAVGLETGNAEWWNDLGVVLQGLARDQEALACYERALIQNPELVQAMYNAGTVLRQLGLYRKSLDYLEQVAKLRPDSEEIHGNMGNALRALGMHEQALASYERALTLKPDYAEAQNGMGVLLLETGNTEQALTHFNKALALKPDFAEACNNRGAALAGVYRVKEAVADYRRALELKPGYAEASNNLAAILGDMAVFDETYALLAHARRRKPGYAEARSNYLFTLNYDPDKSAEEVFSGYRESAQKTEGARRNVKATWDGRRKLRIGYLSPDFRHHSARHFLQPVLERHDRSAFEVNCYAEVRIPDQQTEIYKRHADRWCSTVGMTDDELADRITADGIDVLVDLAGHTLGNRLGALAQRPAPVQVSYLVGYGYTTGLTGVDWFLADRRFVPEDAQRFYSEKIWYLDRIPLCYRPAAEMPAVGELPARKSGTVTFGCFSRAIRVNYKVVRLWSQILKAVPNSRLLLNTFVFADAWARDEFRSRFAAHGVEPERIELVATRPISATWDAYNRVDITLDPFPHNAGTTLFESLWMGVPIVSLRGTISLGRFGDAILSSLGLDNWVTDSEERYLSVAIEHARSLDELAGLRNGLRDRMGASPIRDEAGLVRALEDAYRGMVRAAA